MKSAAAADTNSLLQSLIVCLCEVHSDRESASGIRGNVSANGTRLVPSREQVIARYEGFSSRCAGLYPNQDPPDRRRVEVD